MIAGAESKLTGANILVTRSCNVTGVGEHNEVGYNIGCFRLVGYW